MTEAAKSKLDQSRIRMLTMTFKRTMVTCLPLNQFSKLLANSDSEETQQLLSGLTSDELWIAQVL